MEQSETHDQLRREFAGLGIPMDAPGFYDHPAFVAIEKKNPKFLEAYAKFVQSRPIDRTYIAQVRQVVGIVGPMWNEELVLDGRLGACIDLSMVLSRTLESGGVWNYVVKGALTIEFPKNSGYGKTYFWPIDIAKVAAGHVWVCAPPYSIIDLTIHQQPFGGHRLKHVPPFVLSESVERYSPTIVDICSTEVVSDLQRQGAPLTNETLFRIQPNLRGIFQSFPATVERHDSTILNYTPCAISASDRPFEEITSLRLRGRTGYEIYQQRLKPILTGRGACG